MGQGTMSRVCGQKRKKTHILITGIYDAGKTTLVHRLTETDIETVAGAYSIEKSHLNSIIFISWDVGGRNDTRALHRHFYHLMEAIIFMVDGHGMLFDHKDEEDHLQRLLWEEELAQLPLLVVVNKQDLPGALTCQQVWERLNLGQVARDRPMAILPLSMVTEEGLPEVMDWIQRQNRRKQLHTDVIKPLKKAVPLAVMSAYSRMSSALKQAIRQAKHKLSLTS